MTRFIYAYRYLYAWDLGWVHVCNTIVREAEQAVHDL